MVWLGCIRKGIPPLSVISDPTHEAPAQPLIHARTMPMALRRAFFSIRSSSSRSRIRSMRAFSGSIVVSKRLMAALVFFWGGGGS